MTIRSFRTVYENNKPDQQFYSVERNGLVSAKEVVWHAINDLTYRGAFTVANVMYRNTLGGIKSKANSAVTYGSWPIRETVFSLASTGAGYSIGDELILQGGTATQPLVITVTSLSSDGLSGIASFSANNPNYTVPPTAQPSPLTYNVAGGGTLNISGNLVNSRGYAPDYIGKNFTGTSVSTPSTFPYVTTNGGYTDTEPPFTSGTWRWAYGLNGSGGEGGYTTWPTTGAWVWASVDELSASEIASSDGGGAPSPGIEGNVKVGQLVTLNNASGLSSVPAGTTITGINRIQIWDRQSTATGTIYNRTAYWLSFSNNVSLYAGDSLSTQGNGAAFLSSDLQIPNTFTAILEAGAAADPLNDAVGVFANVNGATSDVTTVSVDGLVTQNSFLPSIYAGQRVISYTPLLSISSVTRVSTTVTVNCSASHGLSNGDTVIVGGANELDYNGIFVVTVSSSTVFTYTALSAPAASPATGTLTIRKQGSIDGTVTVTNVSMNTTHTTANITLSSNQSLPDNETLQFVFDQLQPWRLVFEVIDEQVAAVYAGTSIQFSDAARIPKIANSDGVYVDRAGIIGNVLPTAAAGELTFTSNLNIRNDITPDIGFINRTRRVAGFPEAYPLNYALTVTNRGIFFGMWEGSWSVMQKTRSASDNYFNWFLIQRPVDRLTGKPLTTGRAPVFCVNSVGYKYWKFIVRESDVLHPTQGDPQCQSQYAGTNGVIATQTTPYRVPADAHSQDSYGILNSSNQIALSEDSKYLVSFLHNLSTPRFRYSEELDMVGQTSADVCMASNDISITAYSESGPRSYRALSANGPYNTGLRIAVLKDIPT